MEGATIIGSLDGILIPLVAIGLAEIGDKTQLSILLLSSRTREYRRLLSGVMLAFLVADGLAILAGAWVTRIVPAGLVQLVSGLVFVIFGLLTFRDDDSMERDRDVPSRGTFISGFSVIFLSEWGDKTQIASALFAAEYDPWMVFFGVMSALLILSVAAVYLGRLLAERIERKVITKAAGTVFLLIGLSLLISAIPAFDV